MISQLHAMGVPPQDGAQAPNPLVMLLPWIAIFALFYFMFIRPQRKQQKERENMIKALQPGDKVVTISGVFATVAKVNDDNTVMLKIAENTTVKAARSAVDRVEK